MFHEVEQINKEATSESVEFYIDLMTDMEVPDREICEGIEKLRESNIYLELDIKCPDKALSNVYIYNSTIGDVEECD